MENNDKRQIELRRYSDILKSIGNGVILFGVWSVVKTVSLFLLSPKERADLMGGYEASFQEQGITEGVYLSVVFFFILLGLVLDLLIRVYVGRSAIAAGKGKKMSAICIFLTCILILSSAVSLVFTAIHITDAEYLQSQEGWLISSVIELTSGAVLIEMLIASARIKRLQISGGE